MVGDSVTLNFLDQDGEGTAVSMKNSSSMIQVETRLELLLEQPMDALFHLGAHPDRLDRLCGSEVITATQTDGSTLDLHSDMFFDPFGNPVI